MKYYNNRNQDGVNLRIKPSKSKNKSNKKRSSISGQKVYLQRNGITIETTADQIKTNIIKKEDIIKERTKLARSRIRKLRRFPTRYENIMKRKLTRAGFKYVFQKAFFNEYYFCIVDFFLRKHRLIIEIDGKYHDEYEQRKKDRGHNKFLSSMGFVVIRIKNEDVEKITNSELKKIIKFKKV